ncbi:MAG: DUF3772 domain-containing protein [Tropicimonas sp.]|uniref:DUF3772 domain-containing protein n=1 Tax=Tropicimonas sp. TaxID=2067044 RepID=UPI003A8A4A09
MPGNLLSKMRSAFTTFAVLLMAAMLWNGGLPGGADPARLIGAALAQQPSSQAQPAQPARPGQQASTPALTDADYAEWEKLASRTEKALEDNKATDMAFESLRRELSGWRTRFLNAQASNGDQIKMLQTQIDTLGPPPAEGQVESEEIATRRKELQEQLGARQAPVRKAEEAYARAEGLISRIDALIRARQKDKFLQRGPSPVMPATLDVALQDSHSILRTLIKEAGSAAPVKGDEAELRKNLPEMVVLLGLALLLLLRGRTWFKWLVDWVMRQGSGDNRSLVAAMIVSLGQIIVPMIGLVLLVTALITSTMFGSHGEGLLYALPAMGAAFFATRWLGAQIFPRHDNWPTPLVLSSRERLRGRFYASSLGFLFAAAILVQSIAEQFTLQVGTENVFVFPVIVLSALGLAGLARLLMAHNTTEDGRPSAKLLSDDVTDERSLFDRAIQLTGRVCLVFAALAPVAGLLGYMQAAAFMALSPTLTLAIFALVSFLQRLMMGILRLIFGSRRDPNEGLLPVLIDSLFMLASLPFIALVWGARRADLEELWNSIMAGVLIGDMRISPAVLFSLGIAFGIGMLITRVVQTAMRVSILPRTRIDIGGQKAMISGLGYVGVFLSIVAAVSVAGLDLSNLAIVAGALSVGVGFGLQNVVSNFVSGLILLIEQPVAEGDWVEAGGVMGTVRKISVRATTIETFDRNSVIVPNSDLVSNQVTNWTRGNLAGRLILPIGVAYGSDTRKVSAILQEIAEAHPLVIVNPPPMIAFQGFGASSLDFEMRVILRDINFGLATRTELNHQIAERFAAEGVEIPFPQQDLWLRNPEVLRGAPPAGPAVPAVSEPEPGGLIGPVRPDPVPELPGETSEEEDR